MALSAAALLGTAAAVWYGLYRWHFHPLSELRRGNASLQKQLADTGKALNTCYMDKPKESVESFIEGVESHDKVIHVDLGSLHT